jgi:hypothetical protein
MLIAGVGTLSHGLGVAYFVPQASRKLLSIFHITAGGKSITFNKDDAFTDGVLFGTLQNGLYIMSRKFVDANVRASDDNVLLASVVLFADDTKSKQHLDLNLRRDVEVLHRQFGHCDIHLLLLIIKLKPCDGQKVASHVSNPNRLTRYQESPPSSYTTTLVW